MALPVLADLDFGGLARPRGLLDPLLPQDAATKAYVDAGGAVGGRARVEVSFGAFPGADLGTLVVTGLAGITAGANVSAWIAPAATADHSVDEHLAEKISVFAHTIVPGVGFSLTVAAPQVGLAYGAWSVGYDWRV